MNQTTTIQDIMVDFDKQLFRLRKKKKEILKRFEEKMKRIEHARIIKNIGS